MYNALVRAKDSPSNPAGGEHSRATLMWYYVIVEGDGVEFQEVYAGKSVVVATNKIRRLIKAHRNTSKFAFTISQHTETEDE